MPKLPTFYSRDLGSITGYSTWNLWWRHWHWERFFSEYFYFRQWRNKNSQSRLLFVNLCIHCHNMFRP